MRRLHAAPGHGGETSGRFGLGLSIVDDLWRGALQLTFWCVES